MAFSLRICSPAKPLFHAFPPPPPPMVYNPAAINNGRHGVFSPPTPCGTGSPPCGFVVFQLCMWAREEGDRRPPQYGTGWFSLLPFTHTHPPCLCEGMAILSPNPFLWNRMVSLLPTHTYTSFTQYCFETLSLLWKLRLSQGAWRAKRGTIRGAARL